MRKAAAILSAVALAGCAGPMPHSNNASPPPQPLAPVTLTSAQIAMVQAGVRSSLKDPASARFDRVQLWKAGQKDATHIAVCGYVNAKNSFGGYTGDKPFVGVMDGRIFVVAGMGGSDLDSLSVLAVCRKDGLPLI